MAYNVSALPDYTKDNVDALIYRSLFTARTGAIIEAEGNVQTGIKSTENIEIFSTDVIFQTDACGWSPSGNTSFTQRVLTVGKIKSEETLCQKTLETKYTQLALKKGSTYDGDIAFDWGSVVGISRGVTQQECLEILHKLKPELNLL